MNENGNRNVHDMGFAAWLKSVKNLDYQKTPFFDERKYQFVFKMTAEEEEQFWLEFINSDFRQFDNELKSLKNILRISSRS